MNSRFYVIHPFIRPSSGIKLETLIWILVMGEKSTDPPRRSHPFLALTTMSPAEETTTLAPDISPDENSRPLSRVPSYIRFTPRRAVASFENLVALANHQERLKEAQKIIWRDRGEQAVELEDIWECIEHAGRGGLSEHPGSSASPFRLGCNSFSCVCRGWCNCFRYTSQPERCTGDSPVWQGATVGFISSQTISMSELYFASVQGRCDSR